MRGSGITAVSKPHQVPGRDKTPGVMPRDSLLGEVMWREMNRTQNLWTGIGRGRHDPTQVGPEVPRRRISRDCGWSHRGGSSGVADEV